MILMISHLCRFISSRKSGSSASLPCMIILRMFLLRQLFENLCLHPKPCVTHLDYPCPLWQRPAHHHGGGDAEDSKPPNPALHDFVHEFHDLNKHMYIYTYIYIYVNVYTYVCMYVCVVSLLFRQNSLPPRTARGRRTRFWVLGIQKRYLGFRA